ncbi:MAG: SRPBCC family protein [Phycisphaerales bacterium]
MPDRSFRHSVEVPRPKEAVFAALTRVERASDWMDAVQRVERLDEGPLRVGSTYREVRRLGSREVSAVIEVVELSGEGDGPWAITHASTGMGVRATYRFTVAASGAGEDHSVVVHEARVEPVSFLGRLMAGTMLKAMRRADGALVERFARSLDAP